MTWEDLTSQSTGDAADADATPITSAKNAAQPAGTEHRKSLRKTSNHKTLLVKFKSILTLKKLRRVRQLRAGSSAWNERPVGIREVAGSSPARSTKFIFLGYFARFNRFFMEYFLRLENSALNIQFQWFLSLLRI